MKKNMIIQVNILWTMLPIVLIFLLSESAYCGSFSGGDGTAKDPYQIATIQDLLDVNSDPAACFVLVNDINLAGQTFTNAVISPSSGNKSDFRGIPFSGSFNGNGHIIRNVTIVKGFVGGYYLGLFGKIDNDSEIRFLGIENASIDGLGDYIAALVGANYGGNITNCYSNGDVAGNNFVGGLVGQNYNGRISNCYSRGNVIGNYFIGGLIGTNLGAITNCYSNCAVNGNYSIGGLIGDNSYVSNIFNCFWDVEKSGTAISNGGTGKTTDQMHSLRTFIDTGWDFTGESANGTSQIWQLPDGGGYPELTVFTTSYVPTTLDGDGSKENPYQISTAEELGAIHHYDRGACYDLKADIDLHGIKWSTAVVDSFYGKFNGNGFSVLNLTIEGGGFLALFGHLGIGGHIDNLRVKSASVIGGGLVASLVADNMLGSITNCYSSTFIEGSYAGGLVGSNGGIISGCYSTGNVNGIYASGGLVGTNGGVPTQNGGVISNCYSSSTIIGNANTGGLVGYNIGVVTHCYSIGLVTGNSNTGGLVGYDNSITINSYWDVETSGMTTSHAGTGKTTDQMHSLSTFIDTGWDFIGESANGTSQIWQLPDGGGYPELTVFTTSYVPTALDGDGSKENPYQISTAEELGAIHHYDRGACYDLKADIDLHGIKWSTAVVDSFYGKFNGNGFSVLNLTIEGGGYLGLFAQLGIDGNINNLSIQDASITGSGTGLCVAPLVSFNAGSINGCYSNSIVTGYYSVSAFVGDNIGNINRCHSSGTVAGNGDIGGMVGRNFSGTLIAKNSIGSVTNCYSNASYNGPYGSSRIGGLVGDNDGRIINCYSTSTTNSGGGTDIGGLVGKNSGIIDNCYSSGITKGYGSIGGLVGYGRGDISNCYSNGSVTGNAYTGGLVGNGRGANINNCYSNASVSGEGYMVGGLVGYMGNTFNCFWDIVASGIPDPDEPDYDTDGMVGLTTNQMQMQATFTDVGWDFVGEHINGVEDIWRMCVDGAGYPRLAWEYDSAGDFLCPDGVDSEDLSYFAERWLKVDSRTDINSDGITNLFDYYILVQNWIN